MKTMKIRKLSHFKHSMKGEKHKILKLIIHDKIEEKGHGRPHISWIDGD